MEVPPSKSVTHRALLLAAIAQRPVLVRRVLRSEDTDLTLAAIECMGRRVTALEHGIEIAGGEAPRGRVLIDCGAAGTLARLLTAVLSASPGEWHLDGVERLRERPLEPLISALRRLGAKIRCRHLEGRLPIEIDGVHLAGGATRVDAGASSQYLSGLILAALLAEAAVTIEAIRITSAPYVDLTLDMVRRFGGVIEELDPGMPRRFLVRPGLDAPAEFVVEGDDSSASYFAAAAALAGGEVELLGLEPASRHPDRRFVELLRAMGARAGFREDRLVVEAAERLRGVEVDLGDMPDQVPTLAALAPFAEGVTRIRGVAHLRHKESDRLAAMASELTRVGARVTEREDGLEVPGLWAASPPPTSPVEIDAHGDHRIAMSLAVLGLRRPGLTIANPEVVAKSYPGFWADFLRTAGA